MRLNLQLTNGVGKYAGLSVEGRRLLVSNAVGISCDVGLIAHECGP